MMVKAEEKTEQLDLEHSKDSIDLIGLKDQSKALTAAIKNNRSALLIGEAATGKSSLAKMLAKREGRKVYRINLNGYVTPDMLVGRMMARANNGTETFFQYGILVRAMREGAVIILDEINAALPDTLFCLHAILEDIPRIFIPETEEVVLPADGFTIIGTMNPSHDYAGTRGLNAALYSRFSIVLRFPILKGERLVKALSVHSPKTKIDKIIKVANILEQAQKAREEEKITTRITLREGISALEYFELLNESEAIEAAIYSKLEDHEREHIHAPRSVAVDASVSIDEMIKKIEEHPSLVSENKKIKDEIATMKELQSAIEVFLTKKQQEKIQKELEAK